MIKVSRRKTIRSVGAVTILGSVSGCLEDANPLACSDEIVIDTKNVDLSSEKKESSNPIRYNELTQPEQNLIRKAVTKGSYTECVEDQEYIPKYIRRFRSRVLDHMSNNIVYLNYHGDYYALTLRILDKQFGELPR